MRTETQNEGDNEESQKLEGPDEEGPQEIQDLQLRENERQEDQQEKLSEGLNESEGRAAIMRGTGRRDKIDQRGNANMGHNAEEEPTQKNEKNDNEKNPREWHIRTKRRKI
jgi:hypothetical protein